MDNFQASKRQSNGQVPFLAKKFPKVEEVLKPLNSGIHSTSVPYYKSIDFYTSGEAHCGSLLEVKKHFHYGTFNIHWSKQNGMREGERLPSSHQQIPATDLLEFISKLKSILEEIKNSSYKIVLARFIGNKFSRITDRNDPNFWHNSLVDTLENSDLVFRPFQDFRGQWSIRILSPRQSESNPNWTGVCVNFGTTECQEFVDILEKIDAELDEEDRNKAEIYAD